MSYPLYAFREVFVPAVSGGAISLELSGGTTDTLTAGQVGLFPVNHSILSPAIFNPTTSSIVVGVGSYHTVDNISPTMGGLFESDKSKPIKWSTVTRFWKKAASALTNMVISVGWDETVTGPTALVGPTYQCGTFYRLLVEAKGSPAMRTLAHELYRDLEAYTGCCGGNCQSGCTGQLVDAVTVHLQWSDYIKIDPILSSFLSPKVFYNNAGTKTQVYSAYDTSIGVGTGTYVPNTSNPGSVVSCIELTAAYLDTTFGNCTFTPSDHYELEPLLLYASLRMDDGLESDPCQVTTTINTSVPNMVKTITAPVQRTGSGETVVREWINYRRYKTEMFADGYDIDLFRIRTIEDDVCLANITRANLYDEIHLIRQVDFHFNPTSIVDNPMYETVFYVPTGTNSSDLTNFIGSCLSLAGSTVTLETF